MPLSDQSGFIFATPEGPAVFCGQYALLLEEIQLEGAKRMTGKQFVNGRRTFINSTLT
jgi:methionyl-tRNA formyltransferase